MPVDYITMIICALLLVLAAVTPFINPFFRKPEDKDGNGASPETLPQLSVIIFASDNACELKTNLPVLLSQDYPTGFEVIVVVDDKTDHETTAILEQYAAHPNLYTTFVPRSSRYMSRKKLAITIGVKAAKNEWIVLTDAECRPLTDKWLTTMARNCTEDINLVIGYSNYSASAKPYPRFERLRDELYCMRRAVKGTALRTSGNNLMFRKSDFMERRGFEGNLKYLRGEYDFIVNKYAREGATAVETSPEAWIEEMPPTKKTWKNRHLFHNENRRHLARTMRHAMLYTADMCAMYINAAAIVAAAAYSYITGNIAVASAASAALVITVVLRTVIAGRAVSRFGAGISRYSIVFYEAALLLSDIKYGVLYKLSDKNDFISHKI